jgi:hypothetical protein
MQPHTDTEDTTKTQAQATSTTTQAARKQLKVQFKTRKQTGTKDQKTNQAPPHTNNKEH